MTVLLRMRSGIACVVAVATLAAASSSSAASPFNDVPTPAPTGSPSAFPWYSYFLSHTVERTRALRACRARMANAARSDGPGSEDPQPVTAAAPRLDPVCIGALRAQQTLLARKHS